MATTDGDKTCSCGAGCATYGACLRGKRLHTAWRPRDYDTWRAEGERAADEAGAQLEAQRRRSREEGSS